MHESSGPSQRVVSLSGTMSARTLHTIAWNSEDLRPGATRLRAMPAWTIWICGTCLGLAASMGIWRTLHPQGGSVLEWTRTPHATSAIETSSSVSVDNASSTPLDNARFEALVHTLGADYVAPLRRNQAALKGRLAELQLPMQITRATTMDSIRAMQFQLEDVKAQERELDTWLTHAGRLLERSLSDAGVPQSQAATGLSVWQHHFGIDLAGARATRAIERDLLRNTRVMLRTLLAHEGAWRFDPDVQGPVFDDASAQRTFDDARALAHSLSSALKSFEAVDS
jgi:hypothetical protein